MRNIFETAVDKLLFFFFCFVLADPLTYEGHISKTTAVINLKGSIDVMVSPLMLEALQRFVFKNCIFAVIAVYLLGFIFTDLYFTVAAASQNLARCRIFR